MINHRLATDRALVRRVVALRLHQARHGLDAGQTTMLARYLVEVKRRRAALGRRRA